MSLEVYMIDANLVLETKDACYAEESCDGV